MTLRSGAEDGLLERAVHLATANAAEGQLPFGALVVRDGEVVATGVNSALADNDPTAHAEVAAVRAACARTRTRELTGATLVSSCEPCPMCEAVAVLAGVSQIVYAAPKEYATRHGFILPPTLTEMQAVWRGAGSGFVKYVPTAGAEAPFDRFAARSGPPIPGMSAAE